MNKNRAYPYCSLLLPYAIVMAIIATSYNSLNIVTYLLLMILPIFVGAILFAFTARKYNRDLRALIHSIIAVGIYLLFYFAVLLFVKQTNATEFIYQNSKSLFTEGFSIGNEIQLSVGDAILPALLTFAVHYCSIAVVCRRKNN